MIVVFLKIKQTIPTNTEGNHFHFHFQLQPFFKLESSKYSIKLFK